MAPPIFTVPVINPTTKQKIGEAQATYWVDPENGKQYTVPLGYNPQNTITKAEAIVHEAMHDKHPKNFVQKLAMYENHLMEYKTGGPADMQRNFNGKSYGGFVPAFTPITSFDAGLVCSALHLPAGSCEVMGGLLNIKNKVINGSATVSHHLTDLGNNPKNVPCIQNGEHYYASLHSHKPITRT